MEMKKKTLSGHLAKPSFALIYFLLVTVSDVILWRCYCYYQEALKFSLSFMRSNNEILIEKVFLSTKTDVFAVANDY